MIGNWDSFPEVSSSPYISQELEDIGFGMNDGTFRYDEDFDWQCLSSPDSPPISLPFDSSMGFNVSSLSLSPTCQSPSPVAPPVADPGQKTQPPGRSDHAQSMVRERKKNTIKKGEGRDAKKDDKDNYQYCEGHSFKMLRVLQKKKPVSSKVLFELCRLVEERATGTLTTLNRWAKRRMPNAYAWLDDNEKGIGDELMKSCFSQALMKFGLSL
jgi:hypothetical protein